MPNISGMQLLEKVAERGADAAVVVLTACEDLPIAVGAMKLGADDYLVKPVDMAQLLRSVEQALRRREDRLEARIAAAAQAGEVLKFQERLRAATQETLELLVAVLDARERETSCHSKRVSEYAVLLGRELGLSGAELETLRKGALLHDVGKVGIPDAILTKPGELDESERQQMQKHPQIGYRILQAVESLRPAAEIVLAHHANFDGGGYPVRWKGERIPLGSRIFSVVDTFDAMTSDRPYRGRVSYEEACAEITRCAGTQFDPRIVEAFLRICPKRWDEIRAALAEGDESADRAD
jgi:putative nucleotidyltransferase with HDIG domain